MLELRKVIKLGQATLAITLPKDWVKLTGIKDGDMVSLRVVEDGKLLVEKASEEQRKPVVCSLNADCLSRGCDAMFRTIVGLYVNGCDVIVIPLSGPADKFREKVSEIIDKLFGIYVVDETEDMVILQVITDPTKPSMNTSIMRVHLIVMNICEIVLSALLEDRYEVLYKYAAECENCNRVYWLAVRQLLRAQRDRTLMKTLKIRSHLWIVGNRAVLMALKAALHNAKRMGYAVTKLKDLGFRAEKLGEAADGIRGLYKEVSRIAGLAMHSLMLQDLGKADEAINAIKSLPAKVEGLARTIIGLKLTPDELMWLMRLVYSMEGVAYNYKLIAEVAYNRSVEGTGRYVTVDSGSLPDVTDKLIHE